MLRSPRLSTFREEDGREMRMGDAMKIKRGSALMVSLAGAFGLLLLCMGSSRAAGDTAKREVSISINAGETYVIKDLSEESTPAVRVVENPNALVVRSDAPGQLVLVGASEGRWSIAVKTVSGESVTYKVSVTQAANARNPMAAAKTPAAMGAPELSGASASETAAPLDSGSGPVAAAAIAPSSAAAAVATPAAPVAPEVIAPAAASPTPAPAAAVPAAPAVVAKPAGACARLRGWSPGLARLATNRQGNWRQTRIRDRSRQATSRSEPRSSGSLEPRGDLARAGASCARRRPRLAP